jgi:hypothetical protein
LYAPKKYFKNKFVSEWSFGLKNLEMEKKKNENGVRMIINFIECCLQ